MWGTDKTITRLICIELQSTLSQPQNHRGGLLIKLKTSCAQSNEILSAYELKHFKLCNIVDTCVRICTFKAAHQYIRIISE